MVKQLFERRLQNLLVFITKTVFQCQCGHVSSIVMNTNSEVPGIFIVRFFVKIRLYCVQNICVVLGSPWAM